MSQSAESTWRQRANSELEKVVRLFSSSQLPDMCAKALISSPVKPSSRWSFGNQLLMLLSGTADARGFRQWMEAGRSVTKGAKAIYILGPVRKRGQAESNYWSPEIPAKSSQTSSSGSCQSPSFATRTRRDSHFPSTSQETHLLSWT